jgi:hypothetical protein
VNRLELVKRAEERARADRTDGWTSVLLGIPFSVLSLAIVSGVVWFLLSIFIKNYPVEGWAVGIGAVILIVDVWLHPSEEGLRARFYVVGMGDGDGLACFIHPV